MAKDGVVFTVSGDEQLLRQFAAMGGGVQRKIARPAIVKASKIVVKDARSHVPVRTGALKRSLGTKVRTHRGSGTVSGWTGARTGFGYEDDETGRFNDPVRYAHLVENGTRHSAADGSLRAALDTNVNQVLATFRKATDEGIRKQLAKTR